MEWNKLDPKKRKNMKTSCKNCKFVKYETEYCPANSLAMSGPLNKCTLVKCTKFYDGIGRFRHTSEIREPDKRCYNWEAREDGNGDNND